MFQKLLFPVVLLSNALMISIVPLSFDRLYAQEEEGEIILVSERVGEVIDLEERTKYNLFPAIKGFQSAVFLKLPDGSYVLKITYLDETTGEEKVRRIPRHEASIERYRNTIEHYGIGTVQPPLSGGSIAGKIVVGGVGGIAGAFAGIMTPRDPFLYVAGSALGSAICVYIVGNKGDETGSFLATLGGSTLGTIVGFAVGVRSRCMPGVVIAQAIGATIGATIGFNMTRKYKSPAESALINLRDGQMNLAVPRVYFRPDSFGRGNLSQSADWNLSLFPDDEQENVQRMLIDSLPELGDKITLTVESAPINGEIEED